MEKAMKKKSDVTGIVEAFLTQVARRSVPAGHKMFAQVLRADNAKEFLSKSMDTVCQKYGVAREFSCAFSSYQNGGAERAIQTTMMRARVLLAASDLPVRFWPSAVTYAVYLHNRLPCRSRGWLSPHEIEFGVAPDLSDAHIYGSRCFVKKLPNEIKVGEKFKKNAWRGVYLGRSEAQKGHVVYIEEKRKLCVRDSVEFDDGVEWRSHGLKAGPDEVVFVREKHASGDCSPLVDHKGRSPRAARLASEWDNLYQKFAFAASARRDPNTDPSYNQALNMALVKKSGQPPWPQSWVTCTKMRYTRSSTSQVVLR